MTSRISLLPRLSRSQAPALLLTLTLTPFSIATAADATRTLSDCQAITERVARFECYDQIEARSQPSAAPAAGAARSTIPTPAPAPTTSAAPAPTTAVPAAAPTAPVAAPTVAPATQSATVAAPANKAPPSNDTASNSSDSQNKAAVGNFGRQPSATARVQSNAEGNTELVDTIASIKILNSNIREITLSSGQIWRQSFTQRYVLVKGDTITIRPSGWGGDYRLYSERLGGFIQVTRVE